MDLFASVVLVPKNWCKQSQLLRLLMSRKTRLKKSFENMLSIALWGFFWLFELFFPNLTVKNSKAKQILRKCSLWTFWSPFSEHLPYSRVQLERQLWNLAEISFEMRFEQYQALIFVIFSFYQFKTQYLVVHRWWIIRKCLETSGNRRGRFPAGLQIFY